MSGDIRLAVSFRTHPKRVKLQKRLGSDAVLAFIDLMLFAGESKQDGMLSAMTIEDICIAAQWGGDDKEFVDTLVAIGFLDPVGDEFELHDWKTRNAYVSNAPMRSFASATAAHLRWLKERGISCNIKRCPHCAAHARRMRTARNGNRPVPSPSPLPTPTPKEEDPRRRSRADAFHSDSREIKAAKHLFALIQKNNPTAKAPNWQSWAREFDLIFRVDKRPMKEVRRIIDWAQADEFWHKNILSPHSLRKQFDRLVISAADTKKTPEGRPGFTV